MFLCDNINKKNLTDFLSALYVARVPIHKPSISSPEVCGGFDIQYSVSMSRRFFLSMAVDHLGFHERILDRATMIASSTGQMLCNG